MTTQKFCLQHLPIKMTDNTIVNAEVYQDEFNFWHCKIKYPKTGRSHYYSLVNYIDTLFNEQYPYWANVFHKQSRGE